MRTITNPTAVLYYDNSSFFIAKYLSIVLYSVRVVINSLLSLKTKKTKSP